MSKSALKSIKAHLDKLDFQRAADEAGDLVKQDANNYIAFLFLGKAQEELGKYVAAEKALQSAHRLKPEDGQALKGLLGLCERLGGAKLEVYHQTVLTLATIYANQDDRESCADIINKYELCAQKHGSPSQYRHALDLIAPTSPIYNVLEGRVLQPALVYQRVLESATAEEQEWITSQVGARRTRLGARIDQVTNEVRREAIPKFDIEHKYSALISWTQDDEVRWELEQKRFRRMYEDLSVLPAEEKPAQRDKVLNEANGMVAVGQPYSLAWRVVLDWLDEQDLDAWRSDLLWKYIELFEDDGLTKVLRAFLDSKATMSTRDQASHQDMPVAENKLSEADQLILMNEGLDDCPDCLFAYKIVAHTYLGLEEYQSTAETGNKYLDLTRSAKKKYAVDLRNNQDGVELDLATAYIYYQSPRHHAEAKILFEDILTRKPKLTAALLGVGLIYEDDTDYTQAVAFLSRAAEQNPEDLRVRNELAWCKASTGDLIEGLHALEAVIVGIDKLEPLDSNMKAEVLYRIAFCKWNSDTSAAARKDKQGPYKFLLECLKLNASYAPAYTLLGVYFQDYGKSKQRARVALQKAFELSTSELVAAERLAQLFANNGEWDLVELISQRVVSSGKARPAPGSKKKALSWPDAALGVVQLNKQQYSKSIVSFQAALRVNPNEYHCWVGLGESYHNSGRYVAASKVFSRAGEIGRGLPTEQTWFARYMQANVEKEVGAYDNAIKAYEGVLAVKEDEFGVLLALLQTFADNAWTRIARGMFGAAASSAGEAFKIAAHIVEINVDNFNLWKALGDACSAMAHVKAFASRDQMLRVSKILSHGATEASFGMLQDQDLVTVDMLSEITTTTKDAVADKYLIASILAHKRSIHVSAHDIHAQSVGWYNLGSTEHQTWVSCGSSLRTKGQRPRRFLKASIKCFRNAIEQEASNADFWNAFGIVTLTQNPQVAQHSFIRSLNLNENNARTWANLGALYLLNNEPVLANEAFTRAQSVDPEYAEAWVGQALVATLYGNTTEARSLFTHAFEISDSEALSTKRQYVTSAFDLLMLQDNESANANAQSVLQPLLAVRQLHGLTPANVVVSHLLALYAERVEDYTTAEEALQEVCDSVEIEYEKLESEEHLTHFAQAKADLARVQLSRQEYAKAAENAEISLDLSADDVGPTYTESRRKWRLSAHITAGLAHSHSKSIDRSIKMFQDALEEAPGEPDVICMLAQVLWAKGGEQERAAARSQLFDCAENHPEHVQTACLLATMGLSDSDEEVIEAMNETLGDLRMTHDISESDKLKIGKVVTVVQKQMSKTGTAVADATASIVLAPGEPSGWLELFEATSDEHAAEMARQLALRMIPPGGELEAEDVATFISCTGKLDYSQQAIIFAPWKADAYELVIA